MIRLLAFPALRALVATAAVLAGSAVHAMTVEYECTGRRLVTGEFTPRVAQLHFEGNDWTLTRVRDSREARYLNGRAGVTVVTKDRAMTFTHAGQTLACKLKSSALTPEKPPAPKAVPMGVPGVSAPAAR